MSDVCVVGLGKIGLPLACAIARGGHRVRGADRSPSVVELVNRAEEPFPGEAGLAEALAEVTAAGRLTATTDTTGAVAESDVVVIVVPLVVDERAQPDFGAMDSATEDVARGLRPGTLVSYETTLPVHTTRDRFAVALAAGSGLEVGVDLFVVHSPERVFSGRIFADLRKYPKLVGGVDEEAARKAVEFYESFLEFDERNDLPRANGVWDLGSAEAAEMAKLAETTYRDLNIAYANELAIAAEGVGVDVYQVIVACNSQPFSHIHQPGIAVGGHCIPVYPHFLINSVTGMSLPEAARLRNLSMPGHAVAQLEATLGSLDKSRVVILGLSYRAGVKEHAFSGAFALSESLEGRGASVTVHDPWYSAEEIEATSLHPYIEGSGCDAAIIHTAHPHYGNWTEAELPGVRLVYDGRDSGLLNGIDVITLGRGGTIRRSAPGD